MQEEPRFAIQRILRPNVEIRLRTILQIEATANGVKRIERGDALAIGHRERFGPRSIDRIELTLRGVMTIDRIDPRNSGIARGVSHIGRVECGDRRLVELDHLVTYLTPQRDGIEEQHADAAVLTFVKRGAAIPALAQKDGVHTRRDVDEAPLPVRVRGRLDVRAHERDPDPAVIVEGSMGLAVE